MAKTDLTAILEDYVLKFYGHILNFASLSTPVESAVSERES